MQPGDWPRMPAGEAGIDPDLGANLDAAVAEGALAGLHSVLVARRGHLVIERYYAGVDERWGAPLGEVAFEPDTLHDVRSISKSVVSLLYGIALGEGRVPGLGSALVDHFPNYADLARETARRRITVQHALTMTMGLEWDETLPYSDPRNAEIAMERAQDRYRYILDRPILEPPGQRWNYSAGAVAILARLIVDGSGRRLLDYAREKLLGPLGIEQVEWIDGDDGQAAAASGLRLRPRDLARIGQLVANGGRWGAHQLVPADWMHQACAAQVPSEDGLWYGYLFWIGHMRRPGDTWAAGFGNGGQRLMVMPSLDLVIAVTAGRYNHPDHWKLPVAVVLEHVLPAITDRVRPVGA